MIGKVNPSAVAVATPNVGVLAAPGSELIEADVAVPVSYPVRVARTVTVDAVPGLMPVTVIRPVPLIVALPPCAELVPDHVYAELKLLICNWNPVAVQLSTPNVGFSALPVIELIDEDVAVPVSYPVRVVWTVTVDAVPGLSPVTVIRPVPLIVALPPCTELVPDQV